MHLRAFKNQPFGLFCDRCHEGGMPVNEIMGSAPSKELSKSERTRERIMTAATKEFADFGVAGARIDRIAQNAKANKSQIYEYFGNKDRLFEIVLEGKLGEIYETVKFTPDDLPSYAGMLFDFAMDHPDLMRLVMWNGLEQSRSWPLGESVSLASQVEQIASGQRAGIIDKTYPATFLLTLIVTMASAWTAANPFGMSINPDAQKERPDLRAAIIKAVRALSGPQAR